MKKLVLILCLLAVFSMAVGAYASSSNWAIQIKPYTTGWGGLHTQSMLGVAATPTETHTPLAPGVGRADAVIEKGDGTFLTQQIVTANATADNPLTWNLKIGTGGTLTALNIAVLNQEKDFLGADIALDVDNYYYQFKNGITVLATWSTAENHPLLGAVDNWFDVADATNGLLRAKGFTPGAGNTGFFVTDDTATTGGAWDLLEDYSFSQIVVPDVPEPGSMLAFGSGLVGLIGFAIRRRRA